MESQVPTPDTADDTSAIGEDSLLGSIWLKPTATLQYILAHCPDKYVTGLLVLGGIARAIDRASQQNSGDKFSTVSLLLLAVTVGGLTGWITYYVYGWGMSATGRWLGGRASSEAFRTVLAWALVPTVVSLALVIPQAVIFGDDLFRSEPVDTSAFAENARLAFGIVEFGLAIWALVILVSGVRLLQGFSIGRALANILLPGLVIIGVLLVFVGLYKLL